MRNKSTLAMSYRKALAIAAAAFAVVPAMSSLSAIVSPTAASASTLPSGPTDPHFCSDYGEGSGGSYDGVLACNGPYVGPIEFRGNGGSIVTSDTVGFQCVELATRYLYARKGWGVLDENGAEVVGRYGSAHGMAPVLNGHGAVPQVGDVISFSVESNFTDDSGYWPGHVAIVTGVTSTSVTILSENWGGQAAPYTLRMSGSTVQSITTYNEYGTASANTPYIEWLPLAGGSSGYGPYHVIGTGPNGLNERSAPSTSGTLEGNLPQGTTIYLSCQTAGGTYSTNGGSPASENIWDRLTSGAYVADYWVNTAVTAGFSPGIPHC